MSYKDRMETRAVLDEMNQPTEADQLYASMLKKRAHDEARWLHAIGNGPAADALLKYIERTSDTSLARFMKAVRT